MGTAENPATQADVDSYIEYALEYGDKRKNGEEAEKQKDSIAYGKASERLVSDMQEIYGVDVEGKNHVLNDNDIRHIDNSHGRGNSNEKYPVTADDLKQIPDMVENYDNVYYVEKENGQKGIYYEKRHNGTTYYLEAVKNGETLSNKQLIKVGTGTIPDIKGLREQIKERRAASSAPDGTAPGCTSKTLGITTLLTRIYHKTEAMSSPAVNIPRNIKTERNTPEPWAVWRATAAT